MSSLNLRYATAKPFIQAAHDASLVRRDPPRTGANGDVVLPAWWEALAVAGAGIGAYHGYKRNDSVGWAIGWGILGAMFPVIVIPVAFAQGIDKRVR